MFTRLCHFSLPALLICVSAANAFELNANVQIREVLELTQKNELNFGTIEARDGTCTMAADGSLTGSGGQNCTGQSQPAEFVIIGTSGQVVQLAVEQEETVDGVTFSPALNGTTTRSLGEEGSTVNVVGTLTLSSAIPGDKNISYTVTANYQ